ncbi:hypothetical protein GYMLUDRAFT_100498 [Collybiopsis luxurians FD-317 M1]|uniref:DUF6593 domain-containing protein n=1 Tax=Collybiopsis luxurians FD-317 M1 TaxID=944289 RepID=A0A0D0C5T9_9AGAR|nr:hypothetical protein GYMLUDRAFT_100498 [Collybiopsis luxurians FD-317 M1]
MSVKLYMTSTTIEPIKDSTYFDEQGHTVYKVHTPFGFSRTTTITKAIHDDPDGGTAAPAPNILPAPDTDDAADDSSSEEEVTSPISQSSSKRGRSASADAKSPRSPSPEEESTSPSTSSPPMPRRLSSGTRTNFMYLAQIEWRKFKSTKFRFATGRYSGTEVQVKDFFKKGAWGNRGHNRVFTGEDGREYKWVLARHRSELYSNDDSNTPLAIYHKKNPFKKESARNLEIFPAGQHMIDEIVVTFTYIEVMRKARE